MNNLLAIVIGALLVYLGLTDQLGYVASQLKTGAPTGQTARSKDTGKEKAK